MAISIALAGRGVTSGPTADWSNTGNITACDTTYSTVSLSYGSVSTEVSDYIRADQFGFDIPAMATIDGIIGLPRIKSSSSNTILDYSVVVLKNGSVPAGSDDKKDLATYWPTADTTRSYGSPTDLWGTAWTPADINDSGTGFAVRCEYIPGYGSATAYVDCMTMYVYYTSDNIKYGTVSAVRVYHGTSEVQRIYLGTTQIA